MNFPTPSMFASCRHLNLKQRDQPTFQFAHLVQVFWIESVSQEDSCRICRSLGCEHIKHVYFDTCSLFVSLFIDVICLFWSLVLLTLPIFVSLSFTTHDSWVCFPRGVFKVRVSTFSRLLLFVLLIHSSPWQLAQAFPLTLFWTHGTGYSWVVVTRIVEYYYLLSVPLWCWLTISWLLTSFLSTVWPSKDGLLLWLPGLDEPTVVNNTIPFIWFQPMRTFACFYFWNWLHIIHSFRH